MVRYGKTFTEESICLALTSSQPYSKTACDLGTKEATLYCWIKQSKDKAPTITDEAGKQDNLVDMLNRLRKEKARLKEEREILKKAAIFFVENEK